ncbi:gliding motility-associated C-terminal domain-containing protein [Flavobacterium sp.]
MKLFLRILFFIIIGYANSFSQIDNFNLSVTATNETCAANGTLSFSISNPLAGASVLFSIYKLPNLTTPITVTNTSPFTGLGAGVYLVVATQSLGTLSASKQQEVTIEDLIATLTYQITSTKVTCGNDGAIIINAITGNPSVYEIISGPVTRPLQPSNIFNNLPVGIYQIRVKDVCNENVVQTYQLQSTSTQLLINLSTPSLAGCTMVNIGFVVDTVADDGIIKYPLQINASVTTPSGTVITNSGVMNSGTESYSFQVPYFTQQPYFYTFTITDACGNLQIINGAINNVSTTASYDIGLQDCEHKKVKFSNVSSVILVSAPTSFSTSLPITYTAQIANSMVTIFNLTAGNYVFNVVDVCGNAQVISFPITIDSEQPPYTFLFNRTCNSSSLLIFNIQQLVMVSAPSSYAVVLPHDYTSLINTANYAGFNNLPTGTYFFNVIDLCGAPKQLTVVINPVSESPIAIVLEGCDVGLGSLKVEGQMISITLLSAPAAYADYTLPHNFTSNLLNSGSSVLILGLLPPGTYVFQTVDACGANFTITKQILGYQDSSTATVAPNCGSFTVNLIENTNSSQNTYWLQKWNPITNVWVHPGTSTIYSEGSMPTNSNSFPLTLGVNLNISYVGQFRVLKAYKTYLTNTPTPINCFKVITEFDFSDQPKINGINSISCGTTFEVIVDAEGIGALTYRITLKNGQLFVVQNGNSSYFTNLAPAIYSFQVEDSCGNIVNRVFEIINPMPFVIEAEPILCTTQNVTFTVPNFPFLVYQWWKDNQTTTILSTSNSLIIPSFDAAIHNGTYYVKIVYPDNPNSCLNQTLSYTVNFQPDVPNAGTGQSVSYCGKTTTIDLFSLVIGSYDTDGIWSEITNSGTLINNVWNASSVGFGTYQFKYRVEGSCDLISEAIINITFFAIPDAPIASVEAIICEKSAVQLYASTVATGNYVWSGPNSFSSTQQNPVLNNVSSADNGTYTVHVSQNNCQSETAQVDVMVNPLPEFTVNQECLNKEYVLTANGTLDATASFNWTGPNGYSNAQNPITITRAAIGTYIVTITNQNGCSSSQSIDVTRTFCEIPNVITPNNDSFNDDFDLTGFDVKNLEIYSRWGRLVFDKNNYSNEWHGQNNKGEKLPDGTYFYLITYTNLETVNGWVFVNGN